jgi:hypothetical protein
MHTIETLGHPSSRSAFAYTGNVKDGIILDLPGQPHVSADFFQEIMELFRGTTLSVSFVMAETVAGGFGAWVEYFSEQLNTVKLSARYSSYIVAIMAHEGYVNLSKQGEVDCVFFPA